MEQWNQYSKIRVVGRGAHGMAILCRRKSDNTNVVIKELFTTSMSQDERESSQNEIKVLTILRHPNIVAYFDSFTGYSLSETEAMNPNMPEVETSLNQMSLGNRKTQKRVVEAKVTKKERVPSTLMIVMEYADGGTLSDFLESQTALLPEKIILRLFCQITFALHHIHSHNILHRDLKSNNIFISGAAENAVLKIGDFGISKLMSSSSQAETVVGTPAYLSPELCEGKPYNEKSDIWALGCVFYEIAALKKMFTAHNLPALVLKIIKGAGDPVPSSFSKELSTLVMSCVELDPAKRPLTNDILCVPFVQDMLVDTIFHAGCVPGLDVQ